MSFFVTYTNVKMASNERERYKKHSEKPTTYVLIVFEWWKMQSR